MSHVPVLLEASEAYVLLLRMSHKLTRQLLIFASLVSFLVMGEKKPAYILASHLTCIHYNLSQQSWMHLGRTEEFCRFMMFRHGHHRYRIDALIFIPDNLGNTMIFLVNMPSSC